MKNYKKYIQRLSIFRVSLMANIVASAFLGFLYAFFDYHIEELSNFQFMSSFFPWIILFSLFFIPNMFIHYNRPILAIANTVFGLTVEDLSYWFWADSVAYSWSVLYPVYLGIPIDDIFGLIASGILYYLAWKLMAIKIKKEIRYNKVGI
jgi:hypothetical protein